MKYNLSGLLKASFSITAVLILGAVSAALLHPFLKAEETAVVFSENVSYASFSPEVIDGRTGLPIEGAVIVIPGISEEYPTDSQGKTDIIRIPYAETSDPVYPKSWMEVTLFAYAEGYAPYALFHLQLTKDTLRSGPTVILFQGEKPFTIIESPPDAWVSETVEKYRP